MIRLATVFSGIGAIEHALGRMGLEHRIVFACDNGDVDILTKEIGMNIDDIGKELDDLQKKVNDVHDNDDIQDLYKAQLIGMLKEAIAEYNSILSTIIDDESIIPVVLKALHTIESMGTVKKSRMTEYKRFQSEMGIGSKKQQILKVLQVILEISNDYKKDNPLEKLGEDIDFISSDGIEWRTVSQDLKKCYDYLEKINGKRIIRKVQDLSQRVSQLHEKINYISVQKNLEKMGSDWRAKKDYVDSLPERKIDENFKKVDFYESNINDEGNFYVKKQIELDKKESDDEDGFKHKHMNY